MSGMTFKQFKRTLVAYGEMKFSYRGEPYNFQKDPDAAQIKVSVWYGGDYPQCVYSRTVAAQDDSFVSDLISAKIFPDGKSIADGQADIDVEFFT